MAAFLSYSKGLKHYKNKRNYPQNYILCEGIMVNVKSRTVKVGLFTQEETCVVIRGGSISIALLLMCL